ncbi:hypothetical protein [Pseudacidovorax intermedius]|uniref:hypothetical protein n=1 Tax=Pseudacidovorax intermedius TaxID=433924 RepID=UPI0011C07DFF|nr:hypothetical protein [Pseudacidovorax intermedius]
MKAKWIPLCYTAIMAAGAMAAIGAALSAVTHIHFSSSSGKAISGKNTQRTDSGGGTQPGSMLTPQVRQELFRTLNDVSALDGIEPLSVSSYPINQMSSAERANENPQPQEPAAHKISVVLISEGGGAAAVIDERIQHEGDVLSDGSRVHLIRNGTVVIQEASGRMTNYSVPQSLAPSKPAQAEKEKP